MMQNVFMSVIVLTLLLSPLAFAKSGKSSRDVIQKNGSLHQTQYKYQHKNQGQGKQNQYQQQNKDKNYYDNGISEKKSGN